jgi:hypothetical protein
LLKAADLGGFSRLFTANLFEADCRTACILR